MQLARYLDDEGPHVGVVRADETVTPTPWRSFDELFGLDDPLGAVREIGNRRSARVRPLRLLPPVVRRPQMIGTGGNYADHVAEAKAEIQTREPIFIPFLWGAIIGPDDDIVVPTPETLADYEVEFSVMIGRTARHLTEEDAMEYVFGYTIVNDVSAREVMARDRMQAMLCKSVDTFLPVGPYVVTKDEIEDPYGLEIATYLNGEVRQKSTTGAMIWRIPELLAAITATVTLHPGDVVTTGTPGGVGYFRTPPEFMQPGDVITAQVAGVGALTNQVIAGYQIRPDRAGTTSAAADALIS
jgi:2-keto-4-pentenoate hydratase/2-oxohepta-3-ene-1,7-dioic acid hydratase in catechol pathway